MGKELKLKELIELLFERRKTIILATVVFCVIGVFQAVFTQNTYTSSTLIYPQVGELNRQDGISGLASMAGINLNSGSGDFDIPPNIYPKIVNSIGFRKELIYSKISIPSVKDSMTYIDFYENEYKPSLIAALKKYTIGLPGLIISSLNSSSSHDSSKPIKVQDNTVLTLSNNERRSIDLITSQLRVDPDYRDGLIRISFTSPNKYLSLQMAQALKDKLEFTIIKLKTEKAKNDLESTISQYNRTKIDFEEARKKLFIYQDENINLSTSESKSDLLKLQSEYDIKFGVYNQLATQVEKVRIRLNQDKPIFSIIDPLNFPDKKSSPKRGAIVFIWGTMGLLGSMGYVIFKKYLISIKDEFT